MNSSLWWKLCGALSVAVFCGSVAQAANSVISIPLVIQSEVGPIRTVGCLSFTGRKFGDRVWWTESAAASEGQEFADLISSISAKDSARFRSLLDRTWAKSIEKVGEQESALFSQFQSARVLKVPIAANFGAERVYLAWIEFASKAAWVPFYFAKGEDGRFRYLPERSDNKMASLMLDWARAGGSPAVLNYCADGSSAGFRSSLPLATLVSGDSVSKLGIPDVGDESALNSSSAVSGALGLVRQAQAAAQAREFEKYIGTYSLPSKDGMRAWWSGADSDARERFFNAWDAAKIHAWVDLSPITVVILNIGPKQFRSVYVLNRNGRSELLNMSFVANADSLLKLPSSPLLARANERNFVKSLRLEK